MIRPAVVPLLVLAAGVAGAGITAASGPASRPPPPSRSPTVAPDLGDVLRRANRRAADVRAASEAVERRIGEIRGVPGSLPVAGRVTSGYGPARRHPVLGDVRPHRGVDIAAPAGAAVRAAAPGRVVEVGREAGYGAFVRVDHGGGTLTLTAHLLDVLVEPGQDVDAGERIGLVGSTGLSTGPHVHFEVHRGGRPVHPRRALALGFQAP